jgi:hypothetical protein
MTGVVNLPGLLQERRYCSGSDCGRIYGTGHAAGVIVPEYPWLNNAILLAILGGYASVILVMLMGQSRVFFSMSKEGLMPPRFSQKYILSFVLRQKQPVVYDIGKLFCSVCACTRGGRDDQHRDFVCVYPGVYRCIDYA